MGWGDTTTCDSSSPCSPRSSCNPQLPLEKSGAGSRGLRAQLRSQCVTADLLIERMSLAESLEVRHSLQLGKSPPPHGPGHC